jgi:hypothetical protein
MLTIPMSMGWKLHVKTLSIEPSHLRICSREPLQAVRNKRREEQSAPYVPVLFERSLVSRDEVVAILDARAFKTVEPDGRRIVVDFAIFL